MHCERDSAGIGLRGIFVRNACSHVCLCQAWQLSAKQFHPLQRDYANMITTTMRPIASGVCRSFRAGRSWWPWWVTE